MKTVAWSNNEPPSVTILGGPWDGFRVLDVGPVAEFQGESYIGSKMYFPGNGIVRVYMLESLYRYFRGRPAASIE